MKFQVFLMSSWRLIFTQCFFICQALCSNAHTFYWDNKFWALNTLPKSHGKQVTELWLQFKPVHLQGPCFFQGALMSTEQLPSNLWWRLLFCVVSWGQREGLDQASLSGLQSLHSFCIHSICSYQEAIQCWLLQFSSVAQSYPTLCDPMNRSTSGLPVHHPFPEFTQTHVHWVSDAIQPSHPLLSSSPPALNLSQHHGLFKWVRSSHQVAKVLEPQLQHQSFQWTPRTDLLEDGLVGSPCSSRDSQKSSPRPQFKSINSLAFSFLYSPVLISIHDYWKNHSLE